MRLLFHRMFLMKFCSVNPIRKKFKKDITKEESKQQQETYDGNKKLKRSKEKDIFYLTAGDSNKVKIHEQTDYYERVNTLHNNGLYVQ